MSKETPKELLIDAKWDKLIDLSIRRGIYGAGIAGLSSLVLLCGPTSRVAVTALGAGIGLGSAWQQCSNEFQSLVPDLLKVK
mmetsp:Transcript_7950/g.15468  ORF Transcript_7950/g.15468 Transcript_7950/m.15468 type:complete len:82 (-) Transcript_7950:329-574(-)